MPVEPTSGGAIIERGPIEPSYLRLIIWARQPRSVLPARSACLRATDLFLETGFGASCGSSGFNMITEISDPVGESGRRLGRITASHGLARTKTTPTSAPT